MTAAPCMSDKDFKSGNCIARIKGPMPSCTFCDTPATHDMQLDGRTDWALMCPSHAVMLGVGKVGPTTGWILKAT